MPAFRMKAFETYIENLAEFALNAINRRIVTDKNYNIDAVLDGELNRQFRSYVPVKTRRRVGAFFTGSKLAERISCDLLKKY